MKSNLKTILVAGYYGFNNTGDEAILLSILNDIQELVPNASFCIISNNPKETKKRYGVNAIHSNNLEEIIKWAQLSDLIILGGGGIYLDYWGAETNTILTSKQAGISYY